MRRVIAMCCALLLALGLASAGSAAYPERPIKMIVPWAAGGDTDVIKRVWAEMAKKHLDQPIVVTNITGASGTKGAKEAKGSPPDGYTIYSVHESIHTTFHTGVSDAGYKDFEPICLVSSTPSILAASAASPWKTFQELLEDSRKRPGEVKVGATLGSTSHFFPAMVERAAKIKWKYVSYEGTAPRMTALLGGHIELAETNLTQLDKVRAGQMKLLAMAMEKRHPEAPDVPTLAELGVNVTYAVSRGLLAPKGTPEPVLAKLESVCAKVTSDPAFAAEMKKHGTDARFLGRKEYAGFLEKSDAENAELAGALGYSRKK
jgi:tripartite-type tricarboxylate transporter receptor subunit TctC